MMIVGIRCETKGNVNAVALQTTFCSEFLSGVCVIV